MSKEIIFMHTLSIGRHKGGVGNSCYRIVSQLLEVYEVVLFVPSFDSPEFTCEKELIEVNETQVLKLNYSAQGSNDYKNQFLNDLIIYKAQEKSPKAIANFFLGEWSFAITQASKYLDIPLFNFCRGNDIDLGIFQNHKYDLIDSLETAVMNFCVSREMEKKIKSITTNAKTQFIANSVDFNSLSNYANQYDQDIEKTEKSFSFALIGHIKRKKGLELILDKLNYESGETLNIIGDLFPMQTRFLHGFLTLNQRFHDSINHYEFIKDPNELFALMAKQDIICIPSIHDGMPNVLLESMAIGKVVLASNVGGIKDVIIDGVNGFLFNPFSDVSIEKAFNRVRKLSVEELDKIGKNAQRTIEKEYRFKHEKKQYLKNFEKKLKVNLSRSCTEDHYSLSK